MKVLGIDVGLNGALAFYDGIKLDVFDMPVHEITINKKKKKQIDLYLLAQIIDSHAPIDKAVIEEVTASPQMGVTSAFSFGKSAGIAEMVVAASFIPMELVRPAKWKKAMGLSQDKDASRQLASERLPKYATCWARKCDDGRAEATLLAYGKFMGVI